MTLDLKRAEDAAYLVTRGVRALALLDPIGVEADRDTVRGWAQALEEVASKARCMSFVIERGDGVWFYGFAQHRWAIDAYAKMVHAHKDPSNESDHVMLGLMLGYSSQAIEDFLRRSPSNRLWKEG